MANRYTRSNFPLGCHVLRRGTRNGRRFLHSTTERSYRPTRYSCASEAFREFGNRGRRGVMRRRSFGRVAARADPSYRRHPPTTFKTFERIGKSRPRGGVIRGRFSVRAGARKPGPLHRGHHSPSVGHKSATVSYHNHHPRGKSTIAFSRKTNPMGQNLLNKLDAADPNNIITTLYENKVPLNMLLTEEDIDHCTMQLLVSVLSKACKCSDRQSERMNEIMDIVSDNIFLGIKLLHWISNWTQNCLTRDSVEINLSSTAEILLNILNKGSNRGSPKVSAVGTAVHVLSSVLDGFEKKDIFLNPEVKAKFNLLQQTHLTLLKDHEASRSCKERKTNKFLEQPPDDFRKLPVVPLPEELQIDYKPFLRKNIVNGDYRDIDHYLDIHYRLLREDLIAPLREGITEYTKELNENGETEGFRDFRLYNNVEVLGVNPSKTGLGFILHFNVGSRLKAVKWEVSKRLINGSLVCLSKDGFKTLIFGVVTHGVPEHLKNGFLTVSFDIQPYLLQDIFTHSFEMAESPSYFEAYRHVLSCLQEIGEGNLPFSKYIISTTRKPDPPLYIKEDISYTIDLSMIATEEVSKTNLHKLKGISVRNDCEWPSHEELGFDKSQMNAYKAALQEEVCIIQGPPGTGKTYVGLRIVQTLLENKEKWSSNKPLLVICYTNHALDQFLEGILEFQPNGVVRIGGRSSSEKLKDLHISQVRKNAHRTMSGKCEYNKARKEVHDCSSQLTHYQSLINVAKKSLLKFPAMQHVMSHDHRKRFTYYFKVSPDSDPVGVWLGIINEDGRFVQNIHDEIEEDMEQMDNEDTVLYNFIVTDNEELDRRYIEDEDDFFEDDFADTVGSLEMQSPEDTVLVTPNPKRNERFIMQKLSENVAMTNEAVSRIRNVWSLNYQQRWKLYHYWFQLYIDQIRGKMYTLYDEYNKKIAILKELRLDDDLAALSKKLVIGLTTTGAAKQTKLLRAIGPPVVVVEEAAEILEAHVITSLSSSTQHLIMIGDQQQLRPNPTVYKLCKEYKLDVSLFERLINKGMPHHRLSLQHRMRPEISHLLRLHKDFYPGLCDHEMVTKYDNVLGIKTNLFFVEHYIPEMHHGDNKSRSNLHEARYLMSLCKYLLQQGYKNDQITILTAYQGQVHTFRQIMDKTCEGVRVCPIDHFQGEENDIILLSFVRSNEEGSIGFLKVSNRVCVALSRARKGLYCIGNFSLLAQQSELWATIVSDLRDRKLIGSGLTLVCRNHPDRCTEVKTSEDFNGASEGGCDERCAARLSCGHTCQMKCHPTDQEHRKIRCERPCEKTLCNLKHVCPMKCWEVCPSYCTHRIVKKLPCSHEHLVKCHTNPAKVFCSKPCQKKLPCGHDCKEKCGSRCTVFCQQEVERVFQPCGHKAKVRCYMLKCPTKCTALLECGHVCQGTCGKCNNGRYHERCTSSCMRLLVCGHICKQRCFRTCPPCTIQCEDRCVHNKCQKTCGEICIPCREPCQWQCRHHQCTLSCGSECNRKPCDRSCLLRLQCGHKCIGICGEPCPKLCRKCNEEDVTSIMFGNEDNPHAHFVHLSDCEHIVEVKAMDRLMKQHTESEENAIKLPECPWCKTPIKYNKRYNNIIRAIKKDVEKVKIKIKGQHDEIESTRSRLFEEINNARKELLFGPSVRVSQTLVSTFNLGTWLEFFGRLTNMLRNRWSIGDLAGVKCLLDMHHNLRGIDSLKTKILTNIELEDIKAMKQYQHFHENFDYLQEKTRHADDTPTEQEIADWQKEYKRCKHSLSLLQILAALKGLEVNLEEHEKQRKMIDEADRLLSDGFPFDADKDDKVRDILKELKDWNPQLSKIGITETERQMVVKAMGFTRGHWFKCRNGHVYAIGECGGAMQKSQCPECHETIGGTSHRLDEGNALASEMDGARFAAYSEEANNMLNFDLDDIV